MVYFIEAEGIGLIKIGISDQIEHRLRMLRFMSPIALRCVGTMEGGTEAEETIHETFWHLHSHGEWFRCDPGLLAFIEVNARPFRGDPSGSRDKRRRPTDRLVLYCPEGFDDWLYAFASGCDKSLIGLIDDAVRFWAGQHNYPSPPRLPASVLSAPSKRRNSRSGDMIIVASREWRDWLNDIADEVGRDVSKVVRMVLKAYAIHNGYAHVA